MRAAVILLVRSHGRPIVVWDRYPVWKLPKRVLKLRALCGERVCKPLYSATDRMVQREDWQMMRS
ncbi:hypothetical protein GQ53DRAFT_121162 [Thozetella sp. PMI_491]|nr:hypothetical protein GQ53DRAFT_121162 [Thozetella sp. PMI_491]